MMKNEDVIIKIEEYKTLREEILRSYGWILQIQLGVFASTALIFAYLLAEKNISEYAFLVPLSAIIPSYFINQDLLYTIYRISAYINVHLSEFKWEMHIHKFRDMSFKNQLLVFNKFTYFNINLFFYISLSVTCVLIFIFYNSFSCKKMLISFAILYLFYKIFKPVDYHIKRNDIIEEWKKIV